MVQASLAALIHPLQDTEYSNESDLLAACRRREIRAFEQVYLAHGGRLKSLAFQILGNRQDAEDAVQETFLKLLPRDRRFSRAIEYRDVAVPDPDQCVL
jgi:glyoxylase-like metal-dependent hydrolase (beta-lactamase superfamily II)